MFYDYEILLKLHIPLKHIFCSNCAKVY